ncbi:MAG: hypothetical protein AB7F86_11410 [Bdellovibrionales bacterium]
MVNRNFALWKSIERKNQNGDWVSSNWGTTIDCHYQGRLLVEILSMPTKLPISFERAVCILAEKKDDALRSGDLGTKPGQFYWYSANFVSYISDMGFHIELTGDEIESIGPSEVRT